MASASVLSEAEVLKQVKCLLISLEKGGFLTFTRVHVGGLANVNYSSMRGFPDIEVIIGGRVGYMEIKNQKGGKLNPDQERFRDRVLGHNAKWAVIRNVEEALTFLTTEMGLPDVVTLYHQEEFH